MKQGYVKLEDLKPYQALYPIGVGFAMFGISLFVFQTWFGVIENYMYALAAFAPLVAIHRCVKHYIREVGYKRVFAKQGGLCSRCRKPFDYSKNWIASYTQIHHKDCYK